MDPGYQDSQISAKALARSRFRDDKIIQTKQLFIMKKKIIFLAIIAAIGATWFVLANKFESMVTDNYLPRLKEYKEKGVIDFDADNVKIEKYKFKVVVDNFSYDLNHEQNVRIDQVSACYNPFTDNVTIYTSGQKISMGGGETESYINNPKASIKINRSVLTGDFDKVKLAFSMKKYELLSAVDNSVLCSEDSSEMVVTGDFDKTTNQYLIEIKGDDKGVVLKPGYFKDIHNRLKNDLNVLPPEIKEKMTKLISSFSDYANNNASVTGPQNYKTHISLHFDKKYVERLVKTIKHEIKSNELFEDFKVSEDLFGIIVNFIGGDNFGESKILLEIAGDAKDLKGKFDVFGKANYSPEQTAKLANFTSELLANIFNEFKSETNPALVAADFNLLESYIVDIKNMHLGFGGSYKLANSDFDTDLNLAINNYKIDLSAKGIDGKSYTGTLKLSDPAVLLAAKTKFTKEVAIPLLEKTGLRNKQELVKLEKLNSNIEANGFEALKVLSADPDLKAGDSFQVVFSFEPESFAFKANDKPFLKILTDDRIVKFLKGMEEAEEAKEAEQKQEIQSIIEETQDNDAL